MIREIDHMMTAIYRAPPPGTPAASAERGNMLTTPFAVLAMDHTGNLATFSPELLGQKNAEYGDFTIGNVHDPLLRGGAGKARCWRGWTDDVRGGRRDVPGAMRAISTSAAAVSR